jgi:serine/threonine-protein kinase
MKCPVCHTDLPDDARFCLRCGHELAAEKDDAPEAAEPEGTVVMAAGAGDPGTTTVAEAPAKTTVLEGPATTTVVSRGEPVRTEPVVKPGETTRLRPPVVPGEADAAPEDDAFSTGVFDTAQFATVVEGPATTATDLPQIKVEASKKRKKDSGRRARAVAFGAVGLVLAFLIVLFVTWRLEFWGGKTLPDVVGETPAEATAALKELGFEVATKDVVTDTNVGLVLAQDPDGSKRVDTGTTVTLSVGVERTVPVVEGLTVEDAKAALSQMGISNVRLEYQNSSNPEGTVITSSPAEGSVVTKDQVVTLVVAQPFTVPDVVGLAEAEAKEVVSRSGLSAAVVYVASSEASGTVLSTDPVAGTVLDEGGSVTLRVSSPYPSTAYTVTDYLDAQPEDISQFLKDQGYKLSYGTGVDGVCVALWTGAQAQPVVSFSDNPFEEVGGFQLWPVDTLTSGSVISAVRIGFDQSSAPAEVGTLAPTKDCVARVMNACGLVSTQGATTTSSDTAVEPVEYRSRGVSFATTASTMGDYTWIVCVAQPDNGQATATVVAMRTADLNDYFKDNGISLEKYGNSLANYASVAFNFEEL